jgi:hypothetical protein
MLVKGSRGLFTPPFEVKVKVTQGKGERKLAFFRCRAPMRPRQALALRNLDETP